MAVRNAHNERHSLPLSLSCLLSCEIMPKHKALREDLAVSCPFALRCVMGSNIVASTKAALTGKAQRGGPLRAIARPFYHRHRCRQTPDPGRTKLGSFVQRPLYRNRIRARKSARAGGIKFGQRPAVRRSFTPKFRQGEPSEARDPRTLFASPHFRAPVCSALPVLRWRHVVHTQGLAPAKFRRQQRTGRLSRGPRSIGELGSLRAAPPSERRAAAPKRGRTSRQ